MNQYKQPLLTILIIFATAYILSLIGCAPSSDKSVSAPTAAPRAESDKTPTDAVTSKPNEVQLVQIDPSKMKECKSNEVKVLQLWDTALAASTTAIKAMGEKSSDWKKKDEVIKLAQKVIVQCEQLQTYHLQHPCKVLVEKNIINPEGKIKVAYDAFQIHQRCGLPNKYLVQFDALPVLSTQPPVVVQPTQTPPQPQVPSAPEVATDVAARDIHECNEVEFMKLNSWRAALNQAQKSIAALGPQSNWKYNSSALDFTNTATIMCENLIDYHQNQPCKRFVKDDRSGVTATKIYSGESLRQQCATTRTYHYEFAQQQKSLILTKARLYFDTAVMSGKIINPGYASNVTYGQCIVSNTSNNPITYNSQKALVTEARVYPQNGVEGFQMFVLVTVEGIKLECYGLDYQSDQTSKNEVVRLLNQKQTNISLSYELN